MRRLLPLFAALLLAQPLGTPAVLAQQAAAPKPAPLTELVRQVDIPYEQFTLKNGLRVVVHTDRKTPVVAVSVWYGVGSADEPKGKTGFAHLFEHLMFNGSGNYDGEFFEPLEDVGATNYNGNTWYDRTNYFQNVPTGALDRALFLEADRMGNLLPAVTQAKLDNQRGVVQNEKRQGDNQPYGLVDYVLYPTLFPAGHPYHHNTIGSMADLDAASMEDVRSWFRQHYGPNNAVLVLAGDIDAKTARAKVEKYFGAIPRGPANERAAPPVPRLSKSVDHVMSDRVANPRLYLGWTIPGRLDPANTQIEIATAILAGGTSSRLYEDLVREKQLAVGVAGYVLPTVKASAAVLVVDVKPGVDPAQVRARVDQLLGEFTKAGPSADEVQRVATRAAAGTIRGLEQVGGFGGKAVALAEGTLYAGDPGFYKKELERVATATPASVRAAASTWMSGPRVNLTVMPGERGAAEIALVGEAGKASGDTAEPAGKRSADASKLPAVTRQEALSWPDVERGKLSNGVPVTVARRTAVPVVEVLASFDAGNSADPKDKLGTQSLMLSLLDEGTKSRSGPQIVREAERLGAAFSFSSGADTTRGALSALKPNLDASLSLFADVMRNPAFQPADIERVRAIQLTGIAQELARPSSLASRQIMPAIYGPAHPYGVPSSGSGTPEGVKAVTRDDLAGFHARWMRPDNMALYVVGDTSLADMLPRLERAFGDWRPAAGVARGTKQFTDPTASMSPKIVLLDRPNSPQSVIVGGKVLPVTGKDDPIALDTANEVLGGTFTSRLNTDLRETKGWAYGVRSSVPSYVHRLPFLVSAPVQADKTGASMQAILDNTRAFLTTQPPAPGELGRIVNSNTLSLPGSFETNGAVLGALQQNDVLGRPADYYEQLTPRLRALTPETVQAAAKQAIDPKALTWVVVGDAKVVEPQLKPLGLPVEVIAAP